MRNARGYLLIAGATFFWGVNGVVSKFLFIQSAINPVILVEFRMLGGFLILLTLLLLFNPRAIRVSSRDIPRLAIYGSIGLACVQLAYQSAIREGSVSTAIFLQYTSPILTTIYFTLVRRRLPEAYIAVCTCGAVLGSGLLLFGGGTGLSTTNLGIVLGLASSVLMSFYTIYGANVVGRHGPVTGLLYALLFAFFATCLVYPPWRVLYAGLSSRDWLLLLYMSVFGALVPFFMFLSGLQTVPPLQATLLAMLEPVIATITAWLFLHEQLVPLQVMGGSFIILAVIGVEMGRSRAKARPA